MDQNNSGNYGVYNTKSCYLCQKDGLECDGKRPCSACISRNSPHMCMGLELEQQSVSRMPGNSWNGSYNVEETSQRKRKKRSKNVEMTYDDINMRNDTNQFYGLNEHFLNEQEKMNMYMLNEIRNMKEDHNRLNNEISLIKDENRKLNGILSGIFGNSQILNQIAQNMRTKDSLTESVKLNSSSSAITHPSQDNVKWASNPLVVFDLSQASVITANEEFCNMFGYTIDEVKSMNWTKFIHPDYVERTKMILIRHGKANNVRFKQVYVNKFGEPFVSNDTHTLIIDNNGNFKADVVQTIPEKTLVENIKEYVPQHYEFVNNPTVEERQDVINDDFWLNDEYIDQFNLNEQM